VDRLQGRRHRHTALALMLGYGAGAAATGLVRDVKLAAVAGVWLNFVTIFVASNWPHCRRSALTS